MYQKITIVGNLGGDPEMRYMPDGSAVTNFSVATSRNWTNKSSGEKMSQTTWFRVATWGKAAEAVHQYLKKGSKVLVEGELMSDPQTGGPKTFSRQDGSVGTSFEINSREVKFLSSKGEVTESEDEADADYEDDDIPF